MLYRLIASFIGFFAPRAHAQPYHLTDSGWECTGFLNCGSPDDAVVTITRIIIEGVSTFIGALAIVVFIYGAIRMVISQGQEGKEAGKKALIWAVLGLVAAFLTRAIIEFVTYFIYLLGS